MLAHSPRIVTDGMVLCLDAANPKNFNLTEVEVLVVAGGGGGGGRSGGGGGAGGLIYNRNFAVTPGSALTVTVGAGGSGGDGTGGAGSDGSNSVFDSLTAIGGGGGSGDSPTTGRNGGSGGGGKYGSSGGTGTSGQGFAGGSGTSGTWKAGGGGGAGGVGVNGVSNPHKCGDGGPGLGFNISGTFTYYAGGGGGGSHNSNAGGCCDDATARGLGGTGGGGNGGTPGGYNSGDNATTNTGGGGGGGSTIGGNGGAGGNGGSGIVIVRYPGPQKAIGGTVTTVGGHTIHTFTTVGSTTFTPLVATNNSAILGLSDLSGNGNFGTSGSGTNSPTYSTSNQGAIVFDGSNDYIDLNTNNIITGTNPFTFEAFYKVTNASVAAELFGNFGSSYTSNTIWISGRYGVYINASVPYFQGAPLGLGTYHMAFTRTSSGACTLYKNGVVDGTATSTTSISPGQNFRIGSDVNGISEVFGGELYCLRIYDKALSAAEISQNFNSLRGRYGI